MLSVKLDVIKFSIVVNKIKTYKLVVITFSLYPSWLRKGFIEMLYFRVAGHLVLPMARDLFTSPQGFTVGRELSDGT